MTATGRSGAELHVADHAGEELARLLFPGNPNNTGALAFTGDGSFVVLGGDRLAVIDSVTWTVRRELDAHDGGVLDPTVSPDGTRVASTGSDGFVRSWATDDGQLVHLIPLGGL